MELARTDYEEMIAPFIEETLSAIHIALKSADLTASQIEEVLLVGGATRTPLIHSRLLAIFDRPARGEVDPDLCVAIGAAIQGAAIAGESVSAVLVDVTPYTFGTSALGMLGETFYPYCFVPIIPKNTPIPVRKSEAFRTVHDNQKEVDVRIYQGENEDALENIQIGEFRVEDLADAPAGNIIILDLALDRDGILHVSAKEKATGLERRITIDKAMSRYDKKDIEEARQHIDRLFGDAVGSPRPMPDLPGPARRRRPLPALPGGARRHPPHRGRERSAGGGGPPSARRRRPRRGPPPHPPRERVANGVRSRLDTVGARRRRGSGRRAWRSRSDRQGDALTMGRLTRVSPSGAGVTARPQRGVVKVTAVRRCVARHALSQAMFYAARAGHSANAAVRLCL